MKIPYGESNFKKVIKEGFVYIDKTAFIPMLEEAGSFLFLLRPRRFGKSLFLSMLEHYYDIAHKDEFEELFGQLYIGRNLTPLRNSYPVHVGWEAKTQEGVLQVQGYLQLPEIAALKNLSAWLLVTDGERVEVMKL